MRNTAADSVNLGPGLFDQEKVVNVELGYKRRFETESINVTLFHNKIKDMQREVNLSDPVAGIVQVIKNTADATIAGFEFDAMYMLTDELRLNGTTGYTNANYDEVRFDLNSDRVLNDEDKNLD